MISYKVIRKLTQNPKFVSIYIYIYIYICKYLFHSPSPSCRILAQWAQYNEFVDGESKNLALVSWTTANTKLNDNQIQIKYSDINGLIVQGGLTFISWSQLGTIAI